MTLSVLLVLASGQVALPSDRAGIPRAVDTNPPAPGAPNPKPPELLPAGHPALTVDDQTEDAGSTVSAKALLDRLDKMKVELKGRPKTAEIEFALGNLYYDNARWPDAIDYYRQLLDRARGPLRRYLALRQRPHEKTTAERAHCSASGGTTFADLVAGADAKAATGELSAAVFCYEAALLPLTVAMTRRANAWYLIGNDDLAVTEHRTVLELVPDDPDSLFFLGAIQFEGAEGNLPRLKDARDSWKHYLEVARPGVDAERQLLVLRDLVRVQLAIDNHGQIPREASPQMRAMAVGPLLPPPPAPVLTDRQRATLKAAVAKGEEALSAKRWLAAQAAFAQARQFDAADVAAARGQGTALLNLGRLLEAEAALRDALGRDPQDALSLYELGEVFARNGHYAGAARFWLQVIDLDPKLGERLQLSAKIQRAEALE